jgi:hypothetical protein
MTFSKREVTRGQAITAAALGTLAATYLLSLPAAEPTAQEKANIQMINDFCEGWPTHDVTKILSYFADRYSRSTCCGYLVMSSKARDSWDVAQWPGAARRKLHGKIVLRVA